MYSSTLPSTSALDGGGWSKTRPGRLTAGKDPVPIVYEAGWAPEPVWTGAENLAPTGIRSLDRPGRSKSLYRLSYPGPTGPCSTVNLKLSISCNFISAYTIYLPTKCTFLISTNIKLTSPTCCSTWDTIFRENTMYVLKNKMILLSCTKKLPQTKEPINNSFAVTFGY